jgi:L-amino acid N-acyltransferase YncA
MEQGLKRCRCIILYTRTKGKCKDIRHIINESVGFFHIGTMKEMGLKFGQRLDVFLMHKIYKSSDIG